MKAVLIRHIIETGETEIIKKTNYPRRDIEPITTLSAGLEWLLVVENERPIYDIDTQKLEKVETITDTPHPTFSFLNVYDISYNILELPQEEIDAKIQAKLDSDVSATLHNKYKGDGIRAFDRIYALILRERENGDLTTLQAKNIMINLYAPLEPLYKGLWQLVKVNLSNETPPTNAKLLAIFNKVVLKVDNYIQDNY